MEMLVEIAGWLGMILALLAFILVSVKVITGDGYAYQVINLMAVLLLAINLHVRGNIPVLILELSWAVISIFFIVRIFFKNKKTSKI